MRLRRHEVVYFERKRLTDISLVDSKDVTASVETFDWREYVDITDVHRLLVGTWGCKIIMILALDLGRLVAVAYLPKTSEFPRKLLVQRSCTPLRVNRVVFLSKRMR